MANLSGLVVAAATPLQPGRFEIDHEALAAHCERLLALGANGINLLGTTGEATSLSLTQRLNAMQAVAGSTKTLDRFMVGTGAAALADAVSLTQRSVDLGYNGALVLPPFYYKGLSDDDLMYYFDSLVRGVDRSTLKLYLYHIPQYTGLPFSISLIHRLRKAFPGVFVGLKDSSGNLEGSLAFAREVPGFDVFSATEAALPQVAGGQFKGIISASLNVTVPFIAESFKGGAPDKLNAGAAIRLALSSVPLVPAIRWALGDLTGSPSWKVNLPPLGPITGDSEGKLREALAGTEYAALKRYF
ncbi:MAG: dihydrodipicolinate synthase family protein [Alphaproteobacteria bacterium]|nr:dihydrodipicolinate synthase family protein [Alphaproteobacteria bacterium]